MRDHGCVRVRSILRWLPLVAGVVVAGLAVLLLPAALRVSRHDAVPSPHGKGRPYARHLQLAREYVQIEPPRGLHGRWDAQGPVPRLTTSLDSAGTAKFKGWLRTLDDADPKAAAEARAGLSEDLRALLRDPAYLRPDGSSRVPVMISGDQNVACMHVRTLFTLLGDPGIQVDLVQWRLRHPGQGTHFRQDARLLGGYAPEDTRTGIDVHLSSRGPEVGSAALLRLGKVQWEVELESAPREYEDAGSAPERAWSEIADTLEDLGRDTDAARILVQHHDELLAWDHLARLFDALVGAGIRHVTIPSWRLALELDIPPPADVPTPRRGRPTLVTPWTLAGCALAILLAFALTWLPRVRARTHRRS